MIPLVLIIGLVLCGTCAESLHLVNLTGLSNCADEGLNPVAFLTEVRQEINPDNGICDAIHGKYNFTKVVPGTRVMQITVYKCPMEPKGPCTENPTFHEELLDCNRLLEDDSGPWHMYTSAMSGSKCGEEIGEFTLDYSSLRIDHLVKYLDIDDDVYRRFSMRTHTFLETKEVVACVDMDFDLLKVVT